MSEQLKEILDGFGLKRQDLNCKCERQIRGRIADEIVDDWNHVGRTLDVSKLTAIKYDNVTLPRPQDKAVEMLDAWSVEYGIKATCLKLAEALLRQKKREVVEILCEEISNQKKKAPEAGSSGTVSPHQQGVDFECPCCNCDLLDYLDKGCPKTTSSVYPYLDPKGLSENDREDLIQRLSVDTEGIQEKFADLLSATRQSLKKRGKLVSELVCSVLEKQPDILQLDQAKTIDDAFIILTKHTSFFNHEILGRIVKKLGDEDDKKRYETFCSDLKEFCERRIVEVPPTAYSSGHTRRNRKLFVVLGLQAIIDTLDEVMKTKTKIASLLGLRSSQLQVERVDISCVIIVFSISMELSQGVFPLKPATHEELKSCGYTLLESEQMFFEVADRGDWRQTKKMHKQFNLNISNWEGKSLLIVAAEGGHELVLLTLLDGGADVRFIHQTSGKTALFFAAENGHHEATAILLAYGADHLQTDKVGDAPYSLAKKRGHKKVCEELEAYDSRKRPSVRTVSMQQWITESIESIRDTVLGSFLPIYHWMTSDVIGATKAGDIETLTTILEQSNGALIESRESDKHAWTALMIACDRGNYKIVDLLMGKGVNPNEVAKSNGWSSLMLASRRGYLRIVKTLLDPARDQHHRAKPNKQNNAGITALAIAIYEGRTAVALLLLHRGAEVNLPDENGWTPLIRASSEGNLKLVKVILDLGGNVNGQTEEKWSSLMVASHYGHTDVVRELAKGGADFDCSTSAGDTAVHIATLRKNRGVVEELATLGANLDKSNKDGLTALMVATNKGYNEVVDALLEGGANVHYQHPETKWTAIFFAAKNGYVDIYNTLLEYGAKTEVKDKDGTTLSVVSVASHLKQTSILDILGISVDFIPVPNKLESEKCDNNIKTMNSLLIAVESRIKDALKSLGI